MSSRLRYRPEIDGLRAIAVVAVIIFHLDPDWLQGGFLGVDVFFVISGFLITSIVYDQTSAGTFSLFGFWKRRIMRLYPAMMTMVSAVLIVGALFYIMPERRDLLYQSLAAVFSFSNMYLWATTGGYWDVATERIALLHTWTLSLEEQYYLLFPPFLLLLGRMSARRVLGWIALLFVVSLTFSIAFTPHYRSAAFYFLPTRMWELMIGSLLAVYFKMSPKRIEPNNQRYGNVLLALGMVLILTSFFAISNNESFPGYLPLIPCLGTACILLCGASAGPVRTFLTLGPVVYTGKISYSLYLWHWPVIVFLHFLYPTANPLWAVPVMIPLAIASYHLIENPFRYTNSRWLWYAPAVFPVLFFGAWLFLNFSNAAYPVLRELGNIASEESLERGREFRATTSLREEGKAVVMADHGPAIDLVVIGSSHAMVVCQPVADFAQANGLTAVSLATPSIGITTRPEPDIPYTKDAIEMNEKKMAYLEEKRPRVVLVVGKWFYEAKEPTFEKDFKNQLTRISQNAEQVLVLGQMPMADLPESYAKDLRRYIIDEKEHKGSYRIRLHQGSVEMNQRVNRLINELKLPNASYTEATHVLTNEAGDITPLQNDKFLYYDFHHINNDGAKLVFEGVLRERLEDLLQLTSNEEPTPHPQAQSAP